MKIGYIIEEKLTFNREIVLETDLSEDELVIEMERAEQGAETAEDIADNIDGVEGIKVIKYPDRDCSSPRGMEIEYYDHRELK